MFLSGTTQWLLRNIKLASNVCQLKKSITVWLTLVTFWNMNPLKLDFVDPAMSGVIWQLPVQSFCGKSNKTWHFVKLNMTRMLFSFVEWPRETSFLSVKSGNRANNCHLWKNFSFRVADVAPRHLAESHFADRLLSYSGDSKTRKILVLSWVNLVRENYTLNF